ncbi:Conserved_hypothetical protein [Hexamita inflata]|uniref:Uncharacterized protein n=1 Tax=Hexamita inflata TaxID=28002 RepID=A0AA86RJW8_9EUKA|nr:Conserved hypothetical protein [Hexamita inflata]
MSLLDSTVPQNSKSALLRIRGIPYNVTVTNKKQNLLISVENDVTLDRFTGSFNEEAVTYITERSGGTRKISAITTMLSHAIDEMLKRQNNQPSSSALLLQILTSDQLQKNQEFTNELRIFLVIQIQNEYEKAFYPFPLDKVIYNMNETSNEFYLLNQYKEARMEAIRLREALNNIQETNVRSVELKSCSNCNYLDEQIKQLQIQVKQITDDKEEAIEAITKYSQSKQKYKLKYKNQAEENNMLHQKLQEMQEMLKNMKQKEESRIASRDASRVSSAAKQRSNSNTSMTSQTSSKSSFVHNPGKPNVAVKKPISKQNSFHSDSQSDNTFNYSITRGASRGKDIHSVYKETKQNIKENNAITKPRSFSKKSPSPIAPPKKQQRSPSNSVPSNSVSKQNSTLEDIDKRIQMLTNLVYQVSEAK